jgi:hypothetical protein
MTTAIGVHDHPQLKLGLRPRDHDQKSLWLWDFLFGPTIPQHPAATQYTKDIKYGNYSNDRFGVCGPVCVANSRRHVTARLSGNMVAPTQDDVFTLYRQSGNPNFDPSTGAGDHGVNMQVMLQALIKNGIGGIRPLGYARVNVLSVEEMKAAVAIFGFILNGVNLQTSQQNQPTVWDYRPSGQWGGHAVMGGDYQATPEGIDVVTWGRVVRMTDNFVKKQLDEAWVVIWPEHLTNHFFLQSMDVRGFADAYKAVTGQPFPAVIPPNAPPKRSDFDLR